MKNVKLCDLGIATECNFRCKMCYFWKTKKHDCEIMSIEDWKKLIHQFEGIFENDLRIIFSGDGEALLRKGIGDLLLLTHKKFKISLNSNGFLIDEKMAKILSETVDTICLSLDGISPETHDGIRGVPGSYERVMSAIRNLLREKNDMLITINTVIVEENMDELIRLVQWVNQERIHGIIFLAVVMPNNVYDRYWYKNDFKILWPKDNEKVENVVNGLVKLKQLGSKMINSVNQLNCFKTYFLQPESKMDHLKCEVDNVLRIDPRGNVRICDFCEPVGNVKSESIEKIWMSDEANRQREKAYSCKEACQHLINCFK